MDTPNTKKDHLYALLFREAKLVISNYENYLKEKLSSKELAQKMISLRDIIKKIEEENIN